MVSSGSSPLATDSVVPIRTGPLVTSPLDYPLHWESSLSVPSSKSSSLTMGSGCFRFVMPKNQFGGLPHTTQFIPCPLDHNQNTNLAALPRCCLTQQCPKPILDVFLIQVCFFINLGSASASAVYSV